MMPRLAVTAACVLAAIASAPSQTSTYDIAYVAANQIFVMRADGSQPARVIHQGGGILTPSSWSPDGRRLVVLGCREPDAAAVGAGPLLFPICIINVDGTRVGRVLDVHIGARFEWSPDSTRLVFGASHEDPRRDDERVRRGLDPLASAIYVVDVGTRAITRLTPLGINYFPTWSPDGREIAFSGNVDDAQNRDIYVVNAADGSGRRRLTDATTTDVQPAWSPVGDRIAFVAAPRSPDYGADSGIFVMHPDGSHKRRMAAGLTRVDWSRDGKWLIATSPTQLIDSDSGAITDLGTGLMDAIIAPDNSAVIFRTVGADGGIYMIDRTGANRRRIAPGSSFAVSRR